MDFKAIVLETGHKVQGREDVMRVLVSNGREIFIGAQTKDLKGTPLVSGDFVHFFTGDNGHNLPHLWVPQKAGTYFRLNGGRSERISDPDGQLRESFRRQTVRATPTTHFIMNFLCSYSNFWDDVKKAAG